MLRRLLARQGVCLTPMSGCWSMSKRRGSRPTCGRTTRRSGPISTSTCSSSARRCGRFPANLRLQGGTGCILDQLLTELKAKATPRFKAAAAARLERLAAMREARLAQAAKLAADKGKPGAINPHYLMAELGKVLDDEDIIFNEAVTNTPAVLMQIPRPFAQHGVQHQRRRARLVGRDGARRQACRAEPHDGADGRRRQLLFQQSDVRSLRCRSNTGCRSCRSCSTIPAGGR